MRESELPKSEKELLEGGGLSQVFVIKRQEDEGLNVLPSMKPKKLYFIVYGVVKEPMVYLLIACSLAYFFIGDSNEAIMLLTFLILIVVITISQEAKAERALEALKNLSSPRVMVLRNGNKQKISSKELVREDIIFINEGDRVAADAKLLSSAFIASDESLLSGESVPVEKVINDKIFAGTAIVRGQGVALVTEIGINSEIAKIGISIEKSVDLPTRLELQTRDLVKRVAWIAAILCVLVAIIYATINHNWPAGSLVGLSLAMAILPNELPAVLTIFMALGAWRLSHRRVLTRKLSALENLGSATVLCVDKTGTLTLNQMSIQQIYSEGKLIDVSEPNQKFLPEEFHEVLEYGILASCKNAYDPMDIAFISAGDNFLKDTEHLHSNWKLEKEYPMSSELLSITHAWKPVSSGGFVVGAKGSPEAIIDLCHMTNVEAQEANKIVDQMAKSGFRVLGIAKSFSLSSPLPNKQHDFNFTFVGLVGIADPVRSDVSSSLAECYRAGIRVVIITGDHPVTARSIAQKIGLKKPENIITGETLDKMSEIELTRQIKEINIFSRVSPFQKLRIVDCLKAAGEIVAMTGDGVNDAPALKSSHIAIAMGKRGTDVAREASDIVLLEDDFASIVEAIRLGRRVYINLKSALVYLFAVHIPIVGMSVIPVFFNLPLVLLPAHIAFLHLIIEPASSIAFEVEPASKSIMDDPPRDPKEPLFDKQLWLPSFLKGISVFMALLGVFMIALKRAQGEQDARALVFTTLIISNITLIFLRRNRQKNVPNNVVKWLTFATIILLALVLYEPSLRKLFHFSFLHPLDIFICLVIGILSVAWTELPFVSNLKN